MPVWLAVVDHTTAGIGLLKGMDLTLDGPRILVSLNSIISYRLVQSFAGT
jgi:hypothetical protein